MPRLVDQIPDAEVLIAMEPEQLAACLLQDMNSRPGRQRMVTAGHWLYELFDGPTAPFASQYRDAAFRALAEAWNWLEVQGLVVWPDEANGRSGFRVPSRRGEKLATAEAFTEFLRGTELPKEFLHPLLGEKVWLLFLAGDFDTAVFQAFKQVEVAVRDAAGYPTQSMAPTSCAKPSTPRMGRSLIRERLSLNAKRWRTFSPAQLATTRTHNHIGTLV